MPDSNTSIVVCPLAEGDRVDHRKFGTGTVVAIIGSSVPWKIEVTFDEGVGDKRVVHTFLTKISSPDSRPFVYWERQWRPLHGAWLAARRRREEALSSFRPLPDRTLLESLNEAERAAWTSLENFLADEAARRHD